MIKFLVVNFIFPTFAIQIGLYADVAQLAEQLICNQLVGGSNPSIGSKKPCGADTVELSESGLET